jgi:glutamine amidotransferase
MIAIIQYNAGNITSVKNAVERLGFDCLVTADEGEIRQAEKVIFPGVGEASSAMSYLRERKLDKLITCLKQPVLGICLGQHLMCNFSEEGQTACLSIFDARVKKFPSLEIVPHIGWNQLQDMRTVLFDGMKTDDDVYFVHSYYTELNSDTIAVCDYIFPFSAALQKDNFYATQFHPEKSGDIGSKILSKFLML